MKLKILLKRSLLIIAAAAILFSTVIIFFLSFNSPVLGSRSYAFVPGLSYPSLAQPGQAEEPGVFGLPVRLNIPKIKVNAVVESVGLTPLGEVGVPKSPGNAAWYNLAPRPGEKGASIIDGHFGWWKNGAQGAFNNLSKLRKGDKLYVQDQKGATVTFVVREIRIYKPNADTSEIFASKDGKAHLNLITCEGVWNANNKSYPNRLVVFTDKEI